MEGLVSRFVFLKTRVLKQTKGPNLHKPHMLTDWQLLIPSLADSSGFAAQLLLLREAQAPSEIRGFPGLHLTHLSQATQPWPHWTDASL